MTHSHRPPSDQGSRPRYLSMRDRLIKEGCTEEGIRSHLAFILETEERMGRKLDLSRFRVSPSNPDKPHMG